MKSKILGLVATVGLLAASLTANAALVTYSFDWSGTEGYSMTGSFSYDSASAADGAIRDSEVTALFFEGFLNNVSLGSSSTAHTLAGFNFNFNSATGQFFLGGLSGSDTGQMWNYGGTGLAFAAGSFASGLYLGDNRELGRLENPSNLTARAVTAVPEPGTLALLGLGLVGMGMRRRIKAS